ncbi:hypothetical protein LRP67_08855 [Nocardioides sp. cx-169]|uniref:hypothetical protein n=1 Tax=Nocardioides sp. cx-169 TaxID=2899080 RepID=UPI001E37586B|nr:hypothetical protein [Nocardioides sp. cx-169]MCD4534188.1 hypothetical protein [Nocardioides sp. cx-169]
MDNDGSPGPDEPAESKQAPGRRSLWRVVVVLTVVVLSLAATLVAVRAQDSRPRAAVGDVFGHPFSEDPLPHPGEVLLPWARIQVAAGQVSEELPDLLGAEPTVRAPEGGSFVRVEVNLAEDYRIPLSAVSAAYVGDTEIVLRADGRDYPLSVPGGLSMEPSGPLQQDGGRWVAVEGEPEELEVLVTVAGLTQVVDAADGSVEAGRAAGLGALPSPEELRGLRGTPCGEPRRLDRAPVTVHYLPGLECRVQLTLRTPYVDGLGWAETGREFVVVHVVRPRRLSLVSGRGDAAQYWDSRLRFAARLAGREPVAPEVDVNDLSRGGLTLLDPQDPTQVVFEVGEGEPLGDLTLDLLADASLGEPFVTRRHEVRFRWTVPGGELP